MIKKYLKYFIFIISCVFLILLDQLTKRLAVIYLKDKMPIAIIDNILELTYVENRGAAFGILQNKQILFYVLTILILIAIIYLLIKFDLKKENIVQFIFLLLIFSGAVGNFIDRVKNKYVVDFIYFKPIDFPVFNVADICITLGSILMIIILIFVKEKDNKLI